MIKCGVCGANYVVGSGDYYRCASVKERGTCGNHTTVQIARIEDIALSTLQSELLTDEHARLFATEFNREVDRLRKEERSRDADLTERLAQLDTEIEKLAANMLSGVVSPTIARMLAAREDERDGLSRRLQRTNEAGPTILPHPTLRKRFEERVASLRASLSDPENRPEVAKTLTKLIKEVVIRPAGDTGETEAEVTSSLAKLIGFANDKSRPPGEVGLPEVR